MGRDALLEALHRAEEEQTAALRQRQAAAEADLRRDHAAGLERLRQEHADRRQRRAAQLQTELTARAAARASTLRQRAQRSLVQRLETLARQLLPSLREPDPGAVLAALARELPEGSWSQVRVAAADLALARELFPRARVTADPTLSGGLLVRREDGRMQVDNSLDKRLRRLWPELVPVLLHDLTEAEDAAAETG